MVSHLLGNARHHSWEKNGEGVVNVRDRKSHWA